MAEAAAKGEVPNRVALPVIGAFFVAALVYFATGMSAVGAAGAGTYLAGVIGSRLLLAYGPKHSPAARAGIHAIAAVGFGALLAAPAHHFLESLGDGFLVAAWAFAAGAGIALLRGHKAVLDAGDEAAKHTASAAAKGRPTTAAAPATPGPAWAPIALAMLLAGLALFAWGAHSLVSSVVESRRITLILAAVYGLYAVRKLLNLAARGRAASAPGVAGWLRANWAGVAAVALVLVLYAAFRDTLASEVPYFALLEFGLGMSVFGFALAALRHRVKAGLSERPVASPHRAHAPRVDVTTEPEYEGVKRPLEAFIEHGRGATDYAAAVRAAARLEDARAGDVLSPVLRYRRPPGLPALPLAWASAAALAAGLGVTLAVHAFFSLVDDGLPANVTAAILLAGLGLSVYRLQDHARRHALPFPAFAAALLGTLMLAAALLVGVADSGGVAAMPQSVLLVVGAVAVGLLAIPAVASWRLSRRLAKGEPTPEPFETLPEEVQNGLAKSRQAGVVALSTTLILGVLAPPVIEWLPDALPMFEDFLGGFASFYAGLAPIALFGGLGIAASAGLRWLGYSRARDGVMREAAVRRAERLELHRRVMDRLAAE